MRSNDTSGQQVIGEFAERLVHVQSSRVILSRMVQTKQIFRAI